jgi:hypothetical protein
VRRRPATLAFLLLATATFAQLRPGAPRPSSVESSPDSVATAPAITPPSSASSQPQAVPPAQSTGAELRPPSPASISYAGGQLTIFADNSALSDILKTIGKTLGARLEGTTPGAERVFGQYGPGQPREVLDSLLHGSKYDFILVSPIDDADRVQRILLSPHGAASAATVQPNSAPPQNVEEEEDDTYAVVPQPVAPQHDEPVPPAAPAQQPNGQQQVKTPEQLLQELQRLRMQQQQQSQPQQGETPHSNALPS